MKARGGKSQGFSSSFILPPSSLSRASLPYTLWKEGVEVAALGNLVLPPNTEEPKMSDNLTRYRPLSDALNGLRATEPKGNLARHLQTTAHLISGIVGSKRCHLPSVASKAPDGRKPESRVMRFRRWLANERIDAGTYYLPYVEALLANLPEGPLV